ncbi:MAG TPA: DUF11 domain-containing protein [Gaiellaceae bacterium]|jgi:uncharacterized repeat protein (TIGR01451 family)|nr:DUF11 domain-containing protein [Gaiellaceae bacterium]
MSPRSSKSFIVLATIAVAMLSLTAAASAAASHTTPRHPPHHPPPRPQPPRHRNPNLALRLSASAGTVNVGQQVTYTATIVNTGGRTDRNAGFRDLVPGKASVVSTTPSQGSCGGHSVIGCNLGSLARGASATVTIVVTANQPGWMTDYGWVSTNPPGHWTHRHAVSTNVQGSVAKVELRLTHSPGSIDKGQQVTYTATVHNSGNAAASNVAVQDLVPSKASLVSSSASQGSCSGNPTIVCSLGALNPGASATVTIVVTANQQGWMTDHAWVSTNPPGNWQHHRTTSVFVHDVSPNLDLRLTGSPGTVDPGQQVTYSATVTNRGNGPDANAAFQDLLPGRATLVSANASQGSCSGSPVILCNLGALNAGASATVAIVVTGNQSGKLTDHGWVSANPPGHWQHERSVDTNVRNVSPQLALRLGGSPGSLDAGQQVTYTATVTNTGHGLDTNAGFQDLLPGNTTLVSVSASQGTCSGNPTIVCNLGSLSPGGSATVTIVVTAMEPGTITDRGWVSTNPPAGWEHQHSVSTVVHPAPPAPGTTTNTTAHA